MILFPPAKINLGLNVLYKREDGFHELDTCMLPIAVSDVLEMLLSENFEFKQTGLTVDGDQEMNLVVRAFRLMQERFHIPNVAIHLRKNIPMGAGLGGGSSDATYTILGLNEMFNLKLTKIELREIASQLGSDCAFFVENKPQLAKGRGEILSTIQLHLLGYYMKIVNPGIHIGTAEAYNDIKFSTPETSVEQVLDLPIDQWQELLQNSFEKGVFSNHPEIGQLKSKLLEEGAIYASMSGSGSTVYGIYSSQPKLSFPKDYERVFPLDFSN